MLRLFCSDKDATVVLIALEVIPQRGHDLAHDDLIGIFAYQPQHEHAVLPQIVLTERAEQLLVELLATEPIHELEVLLEEADAIPRQRVPHPEEEAVDTGEGHIDEPEPDEDEDLLVEEVDGQRTLHHIVVDVVAEEAHLKVAHGDAWKARRLHHLRVGERGGALLVAQQIGEHFEAVQVVFIAEEFV